MLRPSCIVVAATVLLSSGTASAQVRAIPYVTGLTQPVAVAFDPSDPTREFVVQQNGIIRAIVSGTLVMVSTPLLVARL